MGISILPLTPLLVVAGTPLRDVAPLEARRVGSVTVSMLGSKVIVKSKATAVASTSPRTPSTTRLWFGLNRRNEDKSNNEETENPHHFGKFCKS